MRPILKCDGIHETEVGYHLECLPESYALDELPADEQEWLCPQCCDSQMFVVSEVRGKTNKSINGKSRVHYLCHWQGYGTDDDTHEPLENIPKESRAMINEYNKRLREEQGSTGQGGSKKAKR